MGEARMHIDLTESLREFVEGEVASGRFRDASELVQHSLRLLQQGTAADEERKLEVLRAAIQEGLDDLENGRFSDVSIEEIAARVKAKRRA
ncbi:MAG TPA: type II toxin-antitoxin system ParD family antitoxin [Azospirillaceae bacterium]|nr:type II toxin-antitoxin system ParD family antitoxin [Azospirillaceae bacterium]